MKLLLAKISAHAALPHQHQKIAISNNFYWSGKILPNNLRSIIANYAPSAAERGLKLMIMEVAMTESGLRMSDSVSGMCGTEGGAFRMGMDSERHDPEAMPVHRVTVSSVRIDAAPVMHRHHSHGPKSNINGRGDHPVVHIVYGNARRFVRKGLPTEAQREFAARGGLNWC